MPSLLLEIGANIARLQSDMAKAQRTVDSFASSAKSVFSGIFAGVSVYGVASFLKSTLDAADNLAKLSEKVGIAVEDLSEYKHIAELSGASLETFAKGVQIMSRNMVDAAQGTGDAKDAFNLLGISLKDAEGQLRSNKQVMIDVAERFSKMQDGATKTALAMKIFGKSGAELIPTLNEGRAGLEKMGAEVDALGIRMTTELANAAEEVNDNLDRMAKSAQGAGIQLLHALMPSLVEISNALVEASEGFALFISQTEKASATRKRMAILDELEEVERLMKEGPSWWDKMISAMFAESGDMPENTVAARVYGKQEEWAARKASLEKELLDISKTIRDAELKTTEKKPTDKKPAPMLLDKEAADKAQKERDKWLNEYLKGVDQAMKAEIERNELVGELYMMDWKWIIEKNDKQLKAEEEYMKSLEDIRMAQIEGEIAARQDEMKSLTDLTASTAEQMEKNMSGLFFDVMTGKFEGMGDLAKGVFESIQRAAADYLGQIATDFLFGTSTKQGRSGGFLQSAFGLLGGLFHRGGIVGETPAPMRLIPAMAFAGAPRLHGGLASDEYPAILQKGETVIPKGEKTKQEQAQPPMNIVINAVDAVSFSQLAARNPSAITGPVMEALQKGGQLRNMIRSVI